MSGAIERKMESALADLCEIALGDDNGKSMCCETPKGEGVHVAVLARLCEGGGGHGTMASLCGV